MSPPNWCDPVEDCNGSGYWTVDKYGRSRVPLGAVVATCTLADVVPIVRVEDGDSLPAIDPAPVELWNGPDGLTIAEWCDDGWSDGPDVSDQLPFGDFTPGRYAWLLTAITPCDPVPAKGRLGLWDWASGELDRG